MSSGGHRAASKGAAEVVSALQGREYLKAEQLTLELLAADPIRPQLWAYLGEALMGRRCGAAARRAFGRALLLDPQASWEAAVAKALAALPDGPDMPGSDGPLRAGGSTPTVAAAVLTFNEARCIERCLRSLADAVDEIVVVDSGSTDGTAELARRLPKVKVVRGGPLNDDFAALRNAGLAHVASDWVLWVDADEWLYPEDAKAVREAAALFHGRPEPAVLGICQVNFANGWETRDYSVPRMFAPGRGLIYYGRVHEQVALQGSGMYSGAVLRHSVRIRLLHDGYEPDVMREKATIVRNLRLLERMAAEEPDNPGWLLFYGREMLSAGEVGKALELLAAAERLAESTPNFGRTAEIIMYQANIHMAQKDYDRAEAACLRALAAAPDFPDAHYGLAQARMRKAAVLLQEAERSLKRAKASFKSYRGSVAADRAILDWRADLSLADLARLAGKTAEARAGYARILRERPGLEQARRKLDSMNEPGSMNE